MYKDHYFPNLTEYEEFLNLLHSGAHLKTNLDDDS
jgi:hypothetical protein